MDQRAMGVRGWTLFCLAAAISGGVGWVAGRLAGFPYYHQFQGTLTQQPVATMVLTLVAAAIAVVISVRVAAALNYRRDARVEGALGAFALGGLAMRGGSMASVLAASSGPETLLLMAGELVVLGLVVGLGYWMAGAMSKSQASGDDFGGLYSAGVQFIVFAAMVWMCGKSFLKGQSIGTVFFAGLTASWVAFLLTGKTWRLGWCIPVVCGMLGYIGNAVAGLDPLLMKGHAVAFTSVSPMEYAGVGALGVIFGELLHRGNAALDETDAKLAAGEA